MPTSLSSIKNKTKDALDLDDLRQMPIAIRDYFYGKKANFDNPYDNRKNDTFLQRFKSVRYPVADSLYGSPNEEIANVFLNIFTDQRVLDLIESYTFNKQWTYHPVRPFDKWNSISQIYYEDEDYYWVILVFNKITDPFQSLLNFNMVRIPYPSFVQDLPYRTLYDYKGARFK